MFLILYTFDFVTVDKIQYMSILFVRRECERILIWETIVIILQRCQVQSYGLFVELFERCHLSFSNPLDPMKCMQMLKETNNLCINSENFIKQLFFSALVNKNQAELETEAVMDCLSALLNGSLSKHVNILYSKEKSHIVGHSIFILLQFVNSGCKKSIK